MPEIQRRYTIASYVASPALKRGTRAALQRLGYEVRPAVMQGRWEDASWRSDVRLVDERHIGRVPRDATPVVVLAGDPARQWDNERIIGAAARPADISALYPLLQRALEAQPRAAARVAAAITARGNIDDRRFDATIVTLSQRGCLIRSAQLLDPRTELNLSFTLPGNHELALRAVICGADADGAAVEFSEIDSAAQHAISDYVQRRLATD